MSKETMCSTCSKSIRCSTWAEWKCTELERRMLIPVSDCEHYKKRPKNWKEMKCRCEDCLKNGLLSEEEYEEG